MVRLVFPADFRTVGVGIKIADISEDKGRGIDKASGTIEPVLPEPDTIPSRWEQQISLDETLLLLNRAVHAAVTNVVVTDPRLPEDPIVFHNPAYEGISGYPFPAENVQDFLTVTGEASMNAIRHTREGVAEIHAAPLPLLSA